MTAFKFKFRRDFKLLLEKFLLPFFVMFIVRRAAILRTWQPIIIQTRFANGDDFGMARKLAQGRA